MVFLKHIAIFIILSIKVFAQTSTLIKNVDVDCTGREECLYVIESFKKYEGKTLTHAEIRRAVQFELAKAYYKSFFYEVKDNTLVVVAETKPRIITLNISGTDSVLNRRIKNEFLVKEGEYFDEQYTLDALEKIKQDFFKPESKVGRIETELTPEGVKVNIVLDQSQVRQLEMIEIIGVDGALFKESRLYWDRIKNTALDFTNYKKMLQEYRKLLIERGFWVSSVKENISTGVNGNYKLTFTVILGRRYGVSFYGNKRLTHQMILNKLRKYIQTNKGIYDDISLNRLVRQFYREYGYYYTDASLLDAKGKDLDGNDVTNLYFTISEGKKVRITKIKFNGNDYKTTKQLRSIYSRNGSDLLSSDFLHDDGLKVIAELIKESYVKDGYIYIDIAKPKIDFFDGGESATVTFNISEGNQFLLKKINIVGVDSEETRYFIKDKLKNKVGKPFNVTEIDEDIKNALNTLKKKGYYFSTYTEKRPKKIVEVNRPANEITLNLKFSTGEKSYLGNVIVTGNSQTKDIVIRRELPLSRGDLVTSAAMNDFLTRLRELGLFSSVNISSFVGERISKDKQYLNFVIKVSEKDFGQAEIAPGYRTDLGLKFSTTVAYNNFQGMNRQLIFKAQTNWRTSFSYLDDERRENQTKLLEGLVQMQFVEPYLLYDFLKSQLTFKATFKFERKRYADFDADVYSFSPQLIKEFSDVVSATLNYDFDNIRQFNATDEIDNDQYVIGSLRPELYLDFRDNKNMPRRGSWFNFSWEFANPFLGSQDDDDLVINYHKAIIRNFNYIPLGDITLATSIAVGYEHNFSQDLVDDGNGGQVTSGYIPPLKVFRLVGQDYLRGYSDNESNTLTDGSNVSDAIVRGDAYMFNFRIEPRFYIGDYSAVAIFVDAGRIYIDKVDNFDLLTSAGLSFKIFTPIGSLDFDYGIKIDRNTDDSFGRFHITIGKF